LYRGSRPQARARNSSLRTALRSSRTCLQIPQCIRAQKRSFDRGDWPGISVRGLGIDGLCANDRESRPANLRIFGALLQDPRKGQKLYSAWWWTQSGANLSQNSLLLGENREFHDRFASCEPVLSEIRLQQQGISLFAAERITGNYSIVNRGIASRNREPGAGGAVTVMILSQTSNAITMSH